MRFMYHFLLFDSSIAFSRNKCRIWTELNACKRYRDPSNFSNIYQLKMVHSKCTWPPNILYFIKIHFDQIYPFSYINRLLIFKNSSSKTPKFNQWIPHTFRVDWFACFIELKSNFSISQRKLILSLSLYFRRGYI